MNEEYVKVFLIQNALEDQETKKDLKMQDLKTFDKIKTRIAKCDEKKWTNKKPMQERSESKMGKTGNKGEIVTIVIIFINTKLNIKNEIKYIS